MRSTSSRLQHRKLEAMISSKKSFTDALATKIDSLQRLSSAVDAVYAELLRKLCNTCRTNKYALRLEKYEKWNTVPVDELCAYMGFILVMRRVHPPPIPR